MKDLVNQLTSKVDITPEQAQQVIDVVKDFLGDRLPDPLAAPVKGALEGREALADQLAEGADGIVGKLGGMLGGS